jgi:hypothetical protein
MNLNYAFVAAPPVLSVVGGVALEQRATIRLQSGDVLRFCGT